MLIAYIVEGTPFGKDKERTLFHSFRFLVSINCPKTRLVADEKIAFVSTEQPDYVYIDKVEAYPITHSCSFSPTVRRWLPQTGFSTNLSTKEKGKYFSRNDANNSIDY